MKVRNTTSTTEYIKADEHWLNSHWRPTMGWTYIAICLFDFILAPIFTFWFFGKTGQEFVAWKALTMSDGGLFHLSMGAILGITAWSRGQEKISRYRYGGYNDYNERQDYGQYDQGNTADYRDSLGQDR
jgi:hypothetical protein